jgi:hypothetical protein
MITTADAMSSAACSISTVPLSIGTDVRFGSHAGSKMATPPPAISKIRNKVDDQVAFFLWRRGTSVIATAD